MVTVGDSDEWGIGEITAIGMMNPSAGERPRSG
jgi:hypothetical protein